MFKSVFTQVVTATLGIAVLVIILEHAGGFSQVLGSSTKAYAGVFNTLTGHKG